MSDGITRIGAPTEEWLDAMGRSMRALGVEQYDDCELAYMLDRYHQGASAYAVAAELWGRPAANDRG